MEQVGILFSAKTELSQLINAVKGLDSVRTATQKAGDQLADFSEKSQAIPKQLTIPTIKTGIETIPKKIDISDLQPEKKEALTAIANQLELVSAKGSTAFQKIQRAYDAIEKAGTKASQSQIDKLRTLIRTYEELSKLKVSDPQMIERKAITKLEGIAQTPFISEQRKESLNELIGALKEEVISKTELQQVQEYKAKYDKPPLPKPEEGQKWSDRVSGAGLGKWIAGGTLIAMATGAIKQWADIDTQLTKVEARLGNVREGVKGFGTGLGYTIRESAEIAKIWGEINNTFDKTEARQFVGFSRARGIEAGQALQISQAGRFLQGEGSAREFLNKIDALAKATGMDKGRIGELISSTVMLSKTAAESKIGATDRDVIGTQRFAEQFWKQAGDVDRGIGERGANFIERLNQAISNPGNDVQQAFMMRAVGYGREKGLTLTGARERIEEGIFRRENFQAIMDYVMSMIPDNQELQINALRGALGGQFKTRELREVVTQYTNPEQRQQLLNAMYSPEGTLNQNIDFEKTGKAYVSAGERVGQAMENAVFKPIDKLGAKYLEKGAQFIESTVNKGLDLVDELSQSDKTIPEMVFDKAKEAVKEKIKPVLEQKAKEPFVYSDWPTGDYPAYKKNEPKIVKETAKEPQQESGFLNSLYDLFKGVFDFSSLTGAIQENTQAIKDQSLILKEKQGGEGQPVSMDYGIPIFNSSYRGMS